MPARKTGMAPSLPRTTLARYTTSPSQCGSLPTERASLEYRRRTDVTAAQHDALLAHGWRRSRRSATLLFARNWLANDAVWHRVSAGMYARQTALHCAA